MPIILEPGMQRKSIAQLRVNPVEADILKRAAAAQRVPLARFVREAALKAAEQELAHAVE